MKKSSKRFYISTGDGDWEGPYTTGELKEQYNNDDIEDDTIILDDSTEDGGNGYGPMTYERWNGI